MEDCIFCQIVKGEIPAVKVYETKKVLAFLNIRPLSQGHSLVALKKHSQDIFEISPKDLKEVIGASQKIAQALKKSLGAKGINLLHNSGKAAQQEIFHFHIHIIPRYQKDGLDFYPQSSYQEKDLNKVGQKIKSTLCLPHLAIK